MIHRLAVAFEMAVAFTRAALAPANTLVADLLARREPGRRHRLVAVLDGGLASARPGLAETLIAYAAAHRDRLELMAPPLILPPGEAAKNDPACVVRVQELLRCAGIDRHSFVLAVGGGALLDAAGFAAAVTHRGVRLVRMPSTVLAQADAGVGVKCAVNAFGIKNFTGSFAPPFAVVNDLDLLSTLSPRDRRAGMAEAVKVAVVRDRALFRQLGDDAAALAAFEPAAVERLVTGCAGSHLDHIATAGDPFEQGSARPLDFGHWAAHKLESLTGGGLRHGEAVAIGMALDGRYAVEAGLFAGGEFDALHRLLRALGFLLWHPALEDERLFDGLTEFREHLGGVLSITLPRRIGAVEEAHAVDRTLMRTAIGWLRRTCA